MGVQILVVDDDRASLELTSLLLRQQGHKVDGVSTGLQASRQLEYKSYDVVVTDIYMPDMDGLELIRHIRSTAPNVGVIAVSGGSPKLNFCFLAIAGQLGANVTLRKPLTAAVLRDALARVLPASATAEAAQ